jgi:hypothetical protein
MTLNWDEQPPEFMTELRAAYVAVRAKYPFLKPHPSSVGWQLTGWTDTDVNLTIDLSISLRNREEAVGSESFTALLHRLGKERASETCKLPVWQARVGAVCISSEITSSYPNKLIAEVNASLETLTPPDAPLLSESNIFPKYRDRPSLYKDKDGNVIDPFREAEGGDGMECYNREEEDRMDEDD